MLETVKELIRNAGSMTEREILRKIPGLRSAERDRIIADMERDGLIERRKVPPKTVMDRGRKQIRSRPSYRISWIK